MNELNIKIGDCFEWHRLDLIKDPIPIKITEINDCIICYKFLIKGSVEYTIFPNGFSKYYTYSEVITKQQIIRDIIE